MKCPCCNREMESGFLQTAQRVSWVKSPHLLSLMPRDGEVSLGNNGFGGLSFVAYICKACKKVVVDYSSQV